MKFGRDLLYSIVPPEYRGERNTMLKHARFRNGARVVDQFIPKNVLETNSHMAAFQRAPEGVEGVDWIVVENYGTGGNS